MGKLLLLTPVFYIIRRGESRTMMLPIPRTLPFRFFTKSRIRGTIRTLPEYGAIFHDEY